MLDLLKFQRTFIKNIPPSGDQHGRAEPAEGEREVRTGWLSGVAYHDGGRSPFPAWD